MGASPTYRAALLAPQTVAIAMALSGAEPARNAQGPNWFRSPAGSSEYLFIHKGFGLPPAALTLANSALWRIIWLPVRGGFVAFF
jgi:hypothetical protein